VARSLAFRIDRNLSIFNSQLVTEDPAPASKSYVLKQKTIERLNPEPRSVPVSGATQQGEPPLTTDVRELMRDNGALAESISPMPEQSSLWKRWRRLRDYCLAVVVIDAPLALLAYKVGHSDPYAFVFSISAIALFTSWLSWKVWVIRV
jgi:hypothetical protein